MCRTSARSEAHARDAAAESGINPKVVSERLGHSSVAFTLETYAHVMPGMQPEAAELFRGLIMRHDEREGPSTARPAGSEWRPYASSAPNRTGAALRVGSA